LPGVEHAHRLGALARIRPVIGANENRFTVPKTPNSRDCIWSEECAGMGREISFPCGAPPRPVRLHGTRSRPRSGRYARGSLCAPRPR
jgi:hypothetical protein